MPEPCCTGAAGARRPRPAARRSQQRGKAKRLSLSLSLRSSSSLSRGCECCRCSSAAPRPAPPLQRASSLGNVGSTVRWLCQDVATSNSGETSLRGSGAGLPGSHSSAALQRLRAATPSGRRDTGLPTPPSARCRRPPWRPPPSGGSSGAPSFQRRAHRGEVAADAKGSSGVDATCHFDALHRL